MTQPAQPNPCFKNLVRWFLGAVVTSLIFPLVVDYIKSTRFYTPVDPTKTTVSEPPPQTLAPKIRQLIVRKWPIDNPPQLYGDLAVEFTDLGQVIRTYKGVFGTT